MSRKMTVVFHDEELYTELKVTAARKHTAASEIVSEAVHEWLESREDAELIPVIEASHNEWREKGGRSWKKVERELQAAVDRRDSRQES